MTAPATRVFYGWWMVGFCLLVAVVGWGLGLFGASVYLHALALRGVGSVGALSGAISLFFLVGALAQAGVASAIGRAGPGPVVATGAVAMALGVAGLGQAGAVWQVYAAFGAVGIGWSCLSTTAISTILAPWFERHQGRAVALALIGASVANMIAAPLLLAAIAAWGFAIAMLAAGAVALALLGPVALLMRRNPAALGLLPDGAAAPAAAPPPAAPVAWTRTRALASPALLSVIGAFALGLLAQIGFITHHVSLLVPVIGVADAGATVVATGVTALTGRLFLARYADRMNLRALAGAVLALGVVSLGGMGLALRDGAPPAWVLVAGSVAFGFTIGNVTTLSPIIVRREFGAANFGVVYGAAATVIQLISALGSGVFGLLRDGFGTYAAPLLAGAGLDLVACALVLAGGARAGTRGTR